jgi:hypothetical protein
MKMTLERYVELMNTKFRLKKVAEDLGFENINNVLYFRETDGVYLKFDDYEIYVWFNDKPRCKTSQYYEAIRTVIDDGCYTEETYIKWAIENLK